MRQLRASLACWLVVLASCASDGGQRGTGITVAEGNVVSVQALGSSGDRRDVALRSPATRAAGHASQTGIAEIDVFVEGTDLHATTDANGHFVVRGDFAGDTALRFEQADTGVSARLPVNAPAGGLLTLRDVTIDAATSTAHAAITEVTFTGSVVSLECAESRISLISLHHAADDDDLYVAVLSSSTLHDRRGQPLACTQLRLGDDLDVRGFFSSDGTIGNAEIILQ